MLFGDSFPIFLLPVTLFVGTLLLIILYQVLATKYCPQYRFHTPGYRQTAFISPQQPMNGQGSAPVMYPNGQIVYPNGMVVGPNGQIMYAPPPTAMNGQQYVPPYAVQHSPSANYPGAYTPQPAPASPNPQANPYTQPNPYIPPNAEPLRFGAFNSA